MFYCFLPFYNINKIRKFYPYRLMFSFWIIIVYCILICYDATVKLLFSRLSLAILNHSCYLSEKYLFIVVFSRLVLCVM
jgi:hypothetical protein